MIPSVKPIGELKPDLRTGETNFKRRWYHPDGTATQPTFCAESWQRDTMEGKGFRLNCPRCSASHGYHKADCPVLPIDPWKLVEPGSGQVKLCLVCGGVDGHKDTCATLKGAQEEYETRGTPPEVTMDVIKEVEALRAEVNRLKRKGEK